MNRQTRLGQLDYIKLHVRVRAHTYMCVFVCLVERRAFREIIHATACHRPFVRAHN